MTLYEILKVNSELYGDSIAFIQGETKYTWKQVYKRVNRLANGLISLGIKTGDKAGILLHNCPEYVEILVALQRINAIPVLTHARSSVKEIIDYTNYCELSTLFSSTEFLDIISEVKKVTNIKNWIIIGGKPGENFVSYEKLIDSSPEHEPIISEGEEKIAIIFPTAGTTGKPKPAVLTRKALDSVLDIVPSFAYLLMEAFPETEAPISVGGTKFLVPAPIYHVAGFMPVITQIAMKNTIIFTTSRKFDPEEVCQIIEREGVSACFMVPTMYKKLLDFSELDKYNLKQLKLLCTGASKMPVELKKNLLRRFPWTVLIDGYGSTETLGGVAISVLKHEDIPKLMDGYVGKPYPQIKAKIVDINGKELGPRQIGELVVKSAALFSGYYKDEERSSKVLKDGWYHTGDLCTMDEDGNIYYVGRKDEVIITGGEKVYAPEVEAVLKAHPKIEDAAVLGVQDPVWGEKVKAVIIPKPGETVKEEEIIDYCKKQVAKYKVPKIVEIVKHLPYTDDGKVNRSRLKELYGG